MKKKHDKIVGKEANEILSESEKTAFINSLVEEKTEDERIVEALLQIGLRVSPETRKLIWLTYHSCAIEGSTLTLEETAQTLGLPICDRLIEERKKKF